MLGGLVVVAVVVVAVVLIGGAAENDRVADGVRVAGVDVGGLDEAAARERVRRELDAVVRRPVKVTHASRTFVLRPDRARAPRSTPSPRASQSAWS